MKSHLIVWLMVLISIDAQSGVFDSLVSLVTNLLANPENIINALVNTQQLPVLLLEIIRQLNNVTIPVWILENTANHTSLVSQQFPNLGSIIPFPNTGWYDFIIVGAGTAGSIVASRLSENPTISVLLLEAGGPENILTDIPSSVGLFCRTPLDWAFLTEPQNNSFLNIDNRRAPWHRGKVMGGSSSVNGMVYVRANPSDYDLWANLTGDQSWNYINVLPYFLRSEHNYDQQYCADTTHHNCNGVYPVTSNWQLSENPAVNQILLASAEFGVNQIDLNALKHVGYNWAQQSIVNGNRISVSKAFLESVHDNRPNLDIIANAFVKRVIFSNKRAIGVQYNHLGVTLTVYARKEVILSAGSIKSPHLLLTSGVGPAQQLQNFNIPVIADLPGVGENLQDHIGTIGICYSVPSIGIWPTSINSIVSYVTSRSGPLAAISVFQMYLNSSINTDVDWPDIQINGNIFPLTVDPTGILLNNIYGLKFSVYNQMFTPHFLQPSINLFGSVSRPKSIGNLYLQSSNPYVYPLIQPNYLSHTDDIKVLIEASQWIYRFGNTLTFNNWNATVFPELPVGCETVYSLVNDTLYPDMLIPNDAYLECFARHMTTSNLHFVGTCKMGNTDVSEDGLDVVDTQLRVMGGITGLRVIDSSVMPRITDGNTNAPTMMIAEKGAQIIKNYYHI